MTPFAAVSLALVVIGLPTVMIALIAHRFFKYREKRLEVEALHAAEKAAQYAVNTAELEQRVRVLEQIVTDAGAQTAAQIEALRERPVASETRKKLPRQSLGEGGLAS